MSLFRKEALAARQHRWLGEIVLVRPLSLTLLTYLAIGFAVAVVAFLILATYTKRTTVTGHVVPAGGLVKVYAPEPALVLEAHVAEGQSVREGDVLYVLSGERQSAVLGATHASIGQRLEERRLSLRQEISQTSVLQGQEVEAARARLALAEAGVERLDEQLELQQDRVRLARQTWQRYENLVRQDYIAREQLQHKQEEVLEHQVHLQALRRERLGLKHDLEVLRTELKGLAARHENQLAQLRRALAEINQELIENEVRRSVVITAPRDGTATAVLAQAGQMVGERPLVSLVPSGASLHAELYAPSRAVGFIGSGDTVRLRFDAYPYQKFGHQLGVVESIARTALSSADWNAPEVRAAAQGQAPAAPLYRITVNLPDQAIRAYGLERALQAGMTVEADILHEKLRLYEWIFEPLRTLSGKY